MYERGSPPFTKAKESEARRKATHISETKSQPFIAVHQGRVVKRKVLLIVAGKVVVSASFRAAACRSLAKSNLGLKREERTPCKFLL
jgi:hypothetical protein